MQEKPKEKPTPTPEIPPPRFPREPSPGAIVAGADAPTETQASHESVNRPTVL